MRNTSVAFAEVIESSLKTATALCWDEKTTPPFGTIVEICYQNISAYGIITNIATSSSDTNRTPFAFKQTLEALHRNQPQIFAFIQTTCTITLLWHSEEDNAENSSLPVPLPPPLHAWVAKAPIKKAVQALTNRELFEATIQVIDQIFVDDCLIAIAAQAHKENALSRDELHNFIEKYSQEINNDLRRARRFLQHMERFFK